METVTHIAVRVVVGTVSAGLLAFVGYVFSNLFVPPTGSGEHVLVNIRLLFVAAGAGFGTLAGWSIRDDTRPPMFLVAVVALIGGFLGAWIGLIFAEGTNHAFDVWTRHLQLTQATVLAAAVGANILPLIVSSLMLWLRRES
ncbi:MAG: hypothetical protein HQ548_02500 [Chloroflexi bacterium]|nr:hypothetical protein [Chloroflexota bacterium]